MISTNSEMGSNKLFSRIDILSVSSTDQQKIYTTYLRIYKVKIHDGYRLGMSSYSSSSRRDSMSVIVSMPKNKGLPTVLSR